MSTTRKLAFALAATFAGTFAFGSSAFADDNACKIATKGDSPTAEACKTGGIKAATKLMKEMVKKGKTKGVRFVCDDCHKGSDDYTLTDNAKKDYEKLLAAWK